MHEAHTAEATRSSKNQDGWSSLSKFLIKTLNQHSAKGNRKNKTNKTKTNKKPKHFPLTTLLRSRNIYININDWTFDEIIYAVIQDWIFDEIIYAVIQLFSLFNICSSVCRTREFQT